MEFTNEFSVTAPIDQVWPILVDAEAVAPCVPGARITEVIDSTHYRGTVKVKLGAVQMSYRGELEMRADEAARTITLVAKGTEARGSGGASGTFTIALAPTDSGGTHVELHTQVDVTGRVAQFGRGIMQDVASRMIKEFAGCLEQKVEMPSEEVAADIPGAEAARSASPSDLASGSPAASADSSRLAPAHSGAADAPPAHLPVEPAGSGGNELQLAPLLADLARGRLAAFLRAVASRVEPKGK